MLMGFFVIIWLLVIGLELLRLVVLSGFSMVVSMLFNFKLCR